MSEKYIDRNIILFWYESTHKYRHLYFVAYKELLSNGVAENYQIH